jgi:hypothetical protein
VFAGLISRCLRRKPQERPALADVIAELARQYGCWLDGYDSLVRDGPEQGEMLGAGQAGAIGAQAAAGVPSVGGAGARRLSVHSNNAAPLSCFLLSPSSDPKAAGST